MDYKSFGDTAAVDDGSRAILARAGELLDAMPIGGTFTAECRDADGNLKWTDTFPNLVMNTGKSDILDKYFKGSGYTALHYAGLVDGGSAPTYNAADTMASHAGWSDINPYSNANRPTMAWGTASASGGGAGTAGTGTLASTGIVFNINATATVAGVFITTNNTKAGTTGTLLSAGSFTGGNRAVASGDTPTVTYTFNN